MSAAPRPIQSTTSSTRQLGVALFAVVLATLLVIGLAFAQLSASKATIAPAAGVTLTTFDHGSSSALPKTKPAIAPVSVGHGWSTPPSKAQSERPSNTRGSRGMDRARFAE